jgi:enolase
MTAIADILDREILDWEGNPTIEVDVVRCSKRIRQGRQARHAGDREVFQSISRTSSRARRSWQLEDGMTKDGWSGLELATNMIGRGCQSTDDDLSVTNTERSGETTNRGVANSILINSNQIGTLSQTLDALAMAHRARYTVVISHRSRETEATSTADVAVGTNPGQIKTGSLSRSDRLAEDSRLIGVEERACRRGALPEPPAMKYVNAQRGGTFLRLALWSWRRRKDHVGETRCRMRAVTRRLRTASGRTRSHRS